MSIFDLERRKSLKWFYAFSFILPSFLIILISIVLYLFIYPRKILVINHQPIVVETKTVIAGQDLIYDISYCKYGNYGAKVYRTIQGTSYIPTPIVETISVPGCSIAVVHLPVPKGATPGTYHMNGTAEFNPNPFHKVIVEFKSEDFEIIK